MELTLLRGLERGLRIDGITAPENRKLVRIALFFAIAAIALRAIFWAYTGRLWEDALITTLHSENFVNGLGLTHYRTGEPPLHGFTSPLSVLVPLLGDLIKAGYGLHCIRLVSIFCGALTVLYALGIALHPAVRLSTPAAALLFAYLALDHGQIVWGMSGMETQMVILVLLMSAYYALADKRAALGISLGLCMLARPDFAFWCAIVGVFLLLRGFRTLIVAAGVALAVYLPWIFFTTAYYGTPLPNTIHAKGLGYPMWYEEWDNLSAFGFLRFSVLIFQRVFITPLAPSFAGHGRGFDPLLPGGTLLALLLFALAIAGIARLAVRRTWGLAPIAAFAAVYAIYYVYFVPSIFGWYVMPYTAMFMVLTAYGMDGAASALRWPRLRRVAPPAFAAAYAASIAVLLPLTFTAEKRIQEDIEEQVRQPLGVWLGQVMEPEDSVGSESLGYVGYYSRRTVYDWPGLANRKVVQYLRDHPEGRTMSAMLEHFKPDFMVLRERDGVLWEITGDWVFQHYRTARVFQADPARIQSIPFIEQNIDTSFMVLERNDHYEKRMEKVFSHDGGGK